MSRLDPFSPVQTRFGQTIANRLALAPLTNQQGAGDGSTSAAEIAWLKSRADSGYALVSTAAAAVSGEAHAFPGQLGFHDDEHLPGLAALARAARGHRAIAIAQLLHGGPRALADPIGPIATSTARIATARELAKVVRDFAAATERAARAGFDGAQLHAAYRFLHSAFLTARPDEGAQLVTDTLEAMRAAAPPPFLLSIRLHLGGYGHDAQATQDLVQLLFDRQLVDHADLVVDDAAARALPRFRKGGALLQVSGGMDSLPVMFEWMWQGADLVGVGTAAILHRDFPRQLLVDPHFRARGIPVPETALRREGIAGAFLAYLRRWPGFVAARELAA